jgi:16S rRNA (cytidine1402-2'-O)-methyltransferase
MTATFGADRRGTIVREATKMHEEIVEGTLEELAARFAGEVRGEIVLVIEGGAADPDRLEIGAADLLRLAMRWGASPERAAREIAALTGARRGSLTRLARELAGEEGPSA